MSWQRKSVSSVFPPEYSKYTIKAVNSITKLSTTTSSTARHFIFVCLAVCDNPCYSHTVSCTSLAGAVLPIYICVLYTYSVRPARNPMHHAPTPRKAPLACAHRARAAQMRAVKSSAPNGREGSSEQLLERLLLRHPIQHLGQNRLVNQARRGGRTCGRHGRSGGGGGDFGRRARSDLGFLGLPMVGPTAIQ